MKILVGLTKESRSYLQGDCLRDLGQKYLWKSANLTNDYLFQASTKVFDIFVISAEKMSFYSAKRNIELFRQKLFNPPLLIINTNYNSSQRADLLKTGADDCLSLHANSQELLAKIEVFSRRPIKSFPNLVEHRGLIFDTQAKTLNWNNKGEMTPIFLKTSEIFLIEFFLKNKKRVISKFQILDKISSKISINPLNLAEVHVCSLRKKIKQQTRINIIETVRGLGYRLR